jgi:anti-sigma regulatory factor (Ser/Thr protein kinase)
MLHVRNTPEAIGPASDAAEAWLQDQGASEKASYLVRLAIEELVTNSIKFGYDDSQEHVIDIALTVSDGQLMMVVTDDGRAFDPLAAPSPDLSHKLADRALGGLGIHSLRHLADVMSYERRDDKNRLTIIKRMT